MSTIEARVEGNERDIKNLEKRVDRFESQCKIYRGEIKDMIDEALSNEIHSLGERLSDIEHTLRCNGVSVKKRGLLDRVKDPSNIITAMISGVVAIVVALISGWRPF